MKIGLYIKQLDPKLGGGFSFEDEVLRGILVNKKLFRHEFVVITDWRNKNLEKYLNTHEVQYLTLNNNRIISKILRAYLLLKEEFHKKFSFNLSTRSFIEKKINKNGIQLVMALSPRVLTYDIPYFIVNWDLEHLKQPFFPEVSKNEIWYEREKFYSISLRRAAKIIVGTETNKRELIHYYRINPERINVISFPVREFNSSEENIDIIKKLNIPEQYAFYPAQYWSHKNHISLLKAIKIVKNFYGYDLALVFCGSDKGNLEYIKRKAEELNVDHLVYFLGFVNENEIISLYRNALLLTFVSLFGPENIPPIEAMKLGCPVLAHKTEGSMEQLGSGALLVNALDPEEIAAGIDKIKNDSKFRETLVANGLEKIKNYTTLNYVNDLTKIFNEFGSLRELWPPSTDLHQ